MSSDLNRTGRAVGPPTRLLFICTQNRARSLTAETLLSGLAPYEVTSAGTDCSARVHVTERHEAWADLIFVMQEEHTEFIHEQFREAVNGKEVICLNIPDVYNYMEPVLVAVLRSCLKPYLDLPRRLGN